MRILGGGAKGLGGSNSADVYGMDILVPDYLRSYKYGAAIIGGVGVGILDYSIVSKTLFILKACSTQGREHQAAS